MTGRPRSFSFAKSRRLLGPNAFAGVYAFRCRVSGDWFQIYARPNGMVAARFGVVVSKRAVGKAVERNFCKRLAREVFRAQRAELAGVDLVARARKGVSRASAAPARVEFRELLFRAARRCHQRETKPSA